ncbi:HTH-type transcriptional regulator CdhR [Pontivivens insulae]|uniref:HTH-type transcriptional regulator CdhR n=2 Tax=Pontivivens insulae TaxID=1639689 RepID=A0A2R8AFW0_9RHOB|nr:transcriptional regulator GlxA family with amidase domain [Pontivivens insulae]SPF31111.1 HTH-type transcriptional regulator CdhR [Pontivivens insulae]
MVAYPGVHHLDVVGPLEILATTQFFVEGAELPYDLSVVAAKAGPIKASSGLTITADKSFSSILEAEGVIDTLIVAGGHGSSEQLTNPELLDFMRTMAPRAKRVVSICTGALILAEIGLLDGKRASTHWFWCPVMAQKYPNVTVDHDAIFTCDGNIWTSAGVTSGMDLALALVEMDWGHEVALQVARFSVMYMMRPGGQAQFSAHLLAQKAEDPAINEALAFILDHPGDLLTVTSLAARATMSERTFARRFKEQTGVTPAAYVETARVQTARVALETTEQSIDRIAVSTGFQNAERMRRAFHRHVGISAGDYRERFRMSREPGHPARAGPE